MTFKTVFTDLILSNRALELVPERALTSMFDASIAGRAVQTWYKPTIAWLLERHHWNLAIVRTALTATVNARPSQWRYAFTKPADCAFLVNLDEPDTPVSFRPSLRTDQQGPTFEVIGNVIYSNINATAAEYTSYNVTEADFDEEFAGVIVIALAARLQLAITKRADLAATQQGQANQALADAIARSEDRDYPVWGGGASETQVVLANRALSLLPQEMRTNRDMLRAAGRMARTWYRASVAWTLEQQHWDFATEEQVPVVAAGPDYTYQKPADCASLISVKTADAPTTFRPSDSFWFELDGDTIRSNRVATGIVFTSYAVDEASFSEDFCNVVVAKMAERFAAALSADVSAVQKYQQEAAQALALATARRENIVYPDYYSGVSRDICGRALALVKQEYAPQVDYPMKAARLAAQWYRPTVAWVLEQHHWEFATKRDFAVDTANDREQQWAYAYEKPDNCAYLIDANVVAGVPNFRPSQRANTQLAQFDVIGSRVYANRPVSRIEYTSYAVDEAAFPEEFRNVVVAHLAARFVAGLTGNAEVAAKYQQEAVNALALAIAKREQASYPTYSGGTSDLERVLSNRAFSLLPQEFMAAVDWPKRAARLSRQWFAATVGWLLEQHHWNLATVRSALTPVTSDREWAYAFTVPADCAFLTGIGYAGGCWTWQQNLSASNYARAYERVGSTIYSNIPATFADYSSYDVDPATFSEEFCDIIVLMLAARYAAQLTKNVRIAEQLREDARQAMLRVLARDLNANQRTYGNTPTESEIVRGVGASWAGWLPGADDTVAGTDFYRYADGIGLTIVPDVPSDSPPGQYYYEG